MLLAAGLGTRLRPLTNDRPKALVTVVGRTMLELALGRLQAAGVDHVVINVHHHAELVIDYLKDNPNFGMQIEVSREETLLDTGGGLKHAAHLLLNQPGGSEEPILVHNVDVLSTIDLSAMVQFHLHQQALATLAVQKRSTSRYLLFDEHGQLCGRLAGMDGTPELVQPTQSLEALAFTGIHVISPRIFARMSESGAFSIIDTYLRLAAENEKIVAFRADESYWRDLGKPESVSRAAEEIASGTYSLPVTT